MAKTNPKNNGVQIPFDHHDGFIQKWQEWLQYRKERRLAAYTPTGLKATFTKLKRISNDDPGVAMQIIDQSLENSWQGLFELKPITNGKTTERFTSKPTATGNVAPGGFGQL
jgi:hypothetical protein